MEGAWGNQGWRRPLCPAGSERVSRTGAEGMRLNEACCINQGLLALGNVGGCPASAAALPCADPFVALPCPPLPCPALPGLRINS
jgi:hypothetical protein